MKSWNQELLFQVMKRFRMITLTSNHLPVTSVVGYSSKSLALPSGLNRVQIDSNIELSIKREVKI